MSTRITFVDDELAHYGVKGMKWGTRKVHARIAGKMAAKSQILGYNTPYTATRDATTKTTRNLNKQWRGHKYEATYEKAKQREYRRNMRWSGTGIEVAKRSGDAKTKAMARKEEQHPNRWKYRRAAVGVIAAAGVVGYQVVMNNMAATNKKAKPVYNAYSDVRLSSFIR